jgi:hypothetical protein
MPLIKIYNNDSDPYGLKGHSILKSVRPFIFGYAVIPKLHECCLRRHVRAASTEAVSFCRTFGDEAWSQQCPNLRIEIRGIDFLANLVVMGTEGLDVILGMNWLHRNQATVSCDKRTFKLVSPSGKEVVTELYMPELEEGACHYLFVDSKEANLIEDIRTMSEFPDVFPEELPGMPPERKVEFSIELI